MGPLSNWPMAGGETETLFHDSARYESTQWSLR